MALFAAPLSAEKVGEWEAWIEELTGPRKAEFDEMNARHGLTTHQAYLQATPDGNFLVVVNHDGPGGATFLPSVGASEHEFDRWFVASVADLHGMDMAGPLPPPPERRL
jgi:hypothetical protein